MRRLALSAAALAGLCAAPRAASAQDLPPSRCAAADFDVLGTGPDTLFLTAGLGPEQAALPEGFAAAVRDAIASELRLPARLTGAAFERSGSTPTGMSVLRPTLAATLLLEIGGDGRATGLRAVQRSLVDSVDAALVAAVRAADSSRSFFAHDGRRAAPVVVRLTLAPDPAEVAGAVAVLRQPRYGAGQNAEPANDLPRLRSPGARKDAGAGAHATFEFVVGADGHAVPETLRVVRFRGRHFAEEAYEWVRGPAYFPPARVGGCAVRQLVRLQLHPR